MLPDVRRGRNTPCTGPQGDQFEKNAPERLSTSGAGKELPDTASRPQLRPSEVRERATPYFRVVLRTPMTFFSTEIPTPHELEKYRTTFATRFTGIL